jgi:hypothetical protein
MVTELNYRKLMLKARKYLKIYIGNHKEMEEPPTIGRHLNGAHFMVDGLALAIGNILAGNNIEKNRHIGFLG